MLKNVEGVDVDVAIDENNFSFDLFNHFDEEAVGVVDLPLEKDFFVRVFATGFFDVVEQFGDFGVGGFLIVELFELHGADAFEQADVFGDEVAGFDERAHDLDGSLDGDVAFEDAGEHGDAGLGIDEGEFLASFGFCGGGGEAEFGH